MERILILPALLLASSLANAAPLCLPPPVDPAGKGLTQGATAGVAWSVWWCEVKFDWRREGWYRLPNATLTQPPVGTLGVKDYALALWAANGLDIRGCGNNTHPEAVPACNAMSQAAAASRPPPIFYDVAASTAADGARPGYKLSATGALVTDGTRHKAGAWCECWRAAVKTGSTQYCVVTQTASYAACRRVQ